MQRTGICARARAWYDESLEAMEGLTVTGSIPARVLVVASRPSVAGALASRLARLGLHLSTAVGEDAARRAAREPRDAVIIEASQDCDFDAAALARHLRAAARPRSLAVLAVLSAPPAADVASAFDATLIAPAYAPQLAARLRFLLRLSIMEDEAKLRADTLAAAGGRLQPPDDLTKPRPIEALYVGAPHPDYLTIDRAIAGAGGSLTASFSTFAAFDFLHEHEFDAVILNALGEDDAAFTICSALRRNTRLFHLPTLMLVDMTQFRRAEEAFARGASDLIPANAEPEEVVSRVLSLTRERRRREALSAAFSAVSAPEVTDAETGLVTPEFFMDHVQHMGERAHAVGRPLAVAVLHAEAPTDVSRLARDDALRQLGSMMRRLVRVEDLAACMDAGVFAVAMPGCDGDAARTAAERLEAVGECTAFDGGDLEDPFQLTLTASIADLQPGESGRALLIRAIHGFQTKEPAKVG